MIENILDAAIASFLVGGFGLAIFMFIQALMSI